MPDCVWFFASLGFSVVRASVSMRIFTRSDLLVTCWHFSDQRSLENGPWLLC